MKKTLTILAFIAAALPVLGGGPVNAQDACLSGAEIQQAVSSGRIMPLEDVLSSNGLTRNDVVGSIKVCEQGGRLAYTIPVNRGGSAENLVVPAN